MICLISFFVFLTIILLDVNKIIDFGKKSGFFISGMVLPHVVGISGIVYIFNERQMGTVDRICSLLFLIFFVLYVSLRLHVFIHRSKHVSDIRVQILYGGRRLVVFSVWAMMLQIVFYLVGIPWWIQYWDTERAWLFWVDMAICFLTVASYLFNGIFRIILCSRQLGIVKRVLAVLLGGLPIINIFVLYYICKVAKEEYENECCRVDIRQLRSNSNVCQTKYPIILIHGVGFKDLRWFNYWGRIPKELVLNGASIHYGLQEGWAVLEHNGPMIKKRIEEVLQETKAEKVNLIAHSKGGLDARYAICQFGLQDKVASLTTINTPHHGSELVPVLLRMPKKLYRGICNYLDGLFRAYGDKCPDTYASGLELTPSFCEEFNRKYPNSPQIYYQSYASVMKHWYSNNILAIPYLLMKKEAGPNNDGLVAEHSAIWGEYRGTFRSSGFRGISHGDMIDLQREDIKGFDVIEVYVSIVKDLKERGF